MKDLKEKRPINFQKTYPQNKYITPILFPAFTDRPHSKPVQSPLFTFLVHKSCLSQQFFVSLKANI